MQNSPLSSSRTSTKATETRSTRVRKGRRQRGRRRFIAAGAIVLVGAIVGNGLVLQPALAARNDRVAATAALAASTGLHAEQLGAYNAVVQAHAEKNATVALDAATIVMTAAKGKASTTALSTSVAALTHYRRLPPERVFDLVDKTTTQTASLRAATAKANRAAGLVAAAEKAATAKAAAAKAAAAKAAAAKNVAGSEAAQQARAKPAAPSRPAAPSNPSAAQAIARQLMASRHGWGDVEFGCLVPLWNRESGWNVNAYNASSGATGIPQALPGNKMASAGADWQTNPATQIAWGLDYIAGRYGTPCAAWDHSESVGWY
ncbi:MAG: hypothetical protein ABIX44_05690 [Cryobacterium sp.]